MYSIVSPDATDAAIQAVLWTVLAVFFVMVILSWWVARKEWLKEEEAALAEAGEEQSNSHQTDQA